MRYKTRLLFSYSSMHEQGLGRPTRTCDLGVSLCVWLVPTGINIRMLVDTNLQVACLSFSTNIDSILRASLPDDKEDEIPFGVCV